MRRGAQGKRRDKAEKPIVDALRAIGAKVTYVSGRECPDLLVRFQGRLYGWEIKSDDGERTESQKESDWPIVRTPAEALEMILG